MKKILFILVLGLFTLSSFTGEVLNGKASWYGDKWHGGPTASGETYDMYSMTTAAAPHIKMHSLLEVTNKANGKTVVVRVNNRGAFHTKKYGYRLLDLSRGAFAEIANLKTGVINVEVKVIRDGK